MISKRHILLSLLTLLSVAGTIMSAQENPMYQLVGFASMGTGTSGGAGGDTVTVSTGTELQNAINAKKDNTTPLVIIVDGLINLANSGGLNKIDVKEVDDVTIIGKGVSGEFEGIGIKVRRASNIIIRNLKIHHVVEGEGDCIGIEGPSDHIWVDHCELYNEYQGVDKDYYDGLLDAKSDAEYITYSWNFLHDSWKSALVGSSESDIHDRKLTMHHNYFLNCNSRLPLFRASTGHFFNNYYKDIASTTINSRISSCVLIENNYFENANNPWVSAYSDVLGGADTVGNIRVNSPFTFSGDTHPVLDCSPDIPYEYAAVLHNAEDVPDLLINFAGVGKLDIGEDPVFTLTTNVTGTGTITTLPDKAFYGSGEVVTLTAVPDPDWEFISWGGDASGSENPLSVTMDEFKTISALFTTDKLSLDYSSSGPGSVSADPDLAMYDPGTSVTLSASASEGAYFSGWTGDYSGSENPLTISIDSSINLQAVFKYESTDAIEIQFEESYCTLTGSTETEHAGFTGSGFVDFENEAGSEIKIAIEASEDVVCNLTLRYAHGKTDDRSMKVLINGIVQEESLDFPSTGSFTSWGTVSFELNLETGNNKIEWQSLTSNGGPNFDKVDISTSASTIAPGTCSEEPETINAPSSLMAAAVSHEQIDLSWIDNSDNETVFILERMIEGGSFSELANLNPNTESYSDDHLDPDTQYSYRIKAYRAEAESSWSNIASATTGMDNSSGASQPSIGITVYPNPAEDHVIISSGEKIQKLTIFGLDGRQLIINSIENQNPITVKLDDLSAGIYLFRIELEKNILTGKFIKK